MYETKNVGLDGALQAVRAVLTAAAETDGLPIVVMVADRDGEMIAFARMDGAGHVPRTMATRKAYTSARTGNDSRAWGNSIRHAGIDLKDLDPFMIGFAGGVCLRVDGVVVGAVGVSGRSEEQDEELARVGAGAIIV